MCLAIVCCFEQHHNNNNQITSLPLCYILTRERTHQKGLHFFVYIYYCSAVCLMCIYHAYSISIDVRSYFILRLNHFVRT